MATKIKEIKQLVADKFEERLRTLRNGVREAREAAWRNSPEYAEGMRLVAAVNEFNRRGLGEIEVDRYTYGNRAKTASLEMTDKVVVAPDILDAATAKEQQIEQLKEEAQLTIALARAPELDSAVRKILAQLKEL